MKRVEKIVRRAGIAACELFTVATIIMLLTTKQYDRMPLAIATIFIVLLPAILERLFCCKISLPVYVFGLLYAIGPMLGQCHKFYYMIPWWDKLLHISGGMMFAVVGLYLFEVLNHQKKSLFLCAVFALCFSIAISVVWEFVEFGSDQLLHSDMQDDTVITALHSYLLGDTLGIAGSIEQIGTVVIDGVPLPVEGYIDIGLIDTMLDMLLECVGALAMCAVYLIDEGKHPAICNDGKRGRLGK